MNAGYAMPEMSFVTYYFLFTKPVCLLSQLLQEDGDPPVNESLSIENTLWASTVVASGKYVTDGAAPFTRQLIIRK